jgi:hypothetical protein
MEEEKEKVEDEKENILITAMDEDPEYKCPLEPEEQDAIFLAKCQDVDKKPTDVQRAKFLRLLRSRCNGFMFDLRESGIGRTAMCIIAEILLKYEQFCVLNLGLKKPYFNKIITL